MRRTILGIMLAGALLGCGRGDDEADAADESTTATEAGEATSPPTTAMPTGCTPATADQVEAITSNLAGSGNQLVDAFTVTTDSRYVLVIANLHSAGGNRLSSADVWAWHPTSGELYAVSSGAQDYSILPASDRLDDNPVGDPAIIQTTDCLIASAQQRNLG
jgi:hypothetical protein